MQSNRKMNTNKSKVEPSVVVRPNKARKGTIKATGFTGKFSDAVTVIVVSKQGVEEISYLPYFGVKPEEGRKEMIVEQTSQVLYLEHYEKDPRLDRILASRSAALRTAMAGAHRAFTVDEGRLLKNGDDYLKTISMRTKEIKSEFRREHPVDVHSEADLQRPKAQRRKLRVPESMSQQDIDERLAVVAPQALEAKREFDNFAASDQGIAVADAAAVIPDYVVRGGPRGDIDQRISGLRAADEAENLSMHDALIRALMVDRQRAPPPVAANVNPVAPAAAAAPARRPVAANLAPARGPVAAAVPGPAGNNAANPADS